MDELNSKTTAMTQPQDAYWLSTPACRIDDFVHELKASVQATHCPRAADMVRGVPVYDCAAVRRWAAVPESRVAVMAEWGRAMLTGPGLVVLKGAFAGSELDAVDAVSAVFQQIIDDQHRSGSGGADHFAKPGANDRVWNALQKVCLRDPASFAAYYANPMLALVSECWLGPAYQFTSQVNVVNPGGQAQSPHRDYHLGFQVPEMAARYPAHVHRLSPVLTLQGAVAHCDMPVESGPTLYLPGSQRYQPGYLSWQLPEFAEHFAQHHVQLPLAKGDAVFFNPALYHAAGSNRTTHIRRMANLLQVSSAFGRAMEAVDRSRMSRALYPVLRSMQAQGVLDRDGVACVVAASAEGYPFPSDLDRDPPAGGLAPPSQQALVLQALDEGWDTATFEAALDAQDARRGG